jgi:hypothetical protein
MKLQFLIASVLLASASLYGQEAALEDLPATKDYESHRITSADPTGANDDSWGIEPGQTRVLAEIQGPGRIVHIRDNITSREPHHLQLHVLRIYWDGEERPSVEAPVGDFFGVGFGFTEKFSSSLIAIDQRPGDLTDSTAMGAARNCYIPMPFARSARITLTNEGSQASRHWVEINYRSYKEPPADVMQFHAQYRQGTPPAVGPYLILDAKGRGHLVGCVLSVNNNDGGWWGEGDEIVEIDGKRSIQGTGSEDYFCESYGLRPGCFPHFGVTLCEEPFVTAYRWHVPDPVTFRESIRFLIEQGSGNPPFKSGNDYFSVAYWYQTEPHSPFPPLASVADRIRWDTSAKGVLEGEVLKILARTGGATDNQTEARWSGGKQLWWRDAKVGEKLEFAVPVSKAGKYRLSMRNTAANDYGTFRLLFDGQPLGQPLDFYSAANVTRRITLGVRELTEGEHKLTVEVTGTNPEAIPRYMFGIDYLKLEAIQ